MSAIDRVALILTPKQPFVDWVRSLPGMDPNTSAEAAKREPLTFLLPFTQDTEGLREFVRQGNELFFVQALALWCEREEDLPLSRGLETFEAWFDWSLAPMVMDLAPALAAMGMAAAEQEGGAAPAPEAQPPQGGSRIIMP